MKKQKTLKQEYLNQLLAECHTDLISQSTDESREAMQYLKGRGLSDESISEHKLGYCSRTRFIKKILWYDEDNPEKDRNLYGFVTGRIIVPIFDEFGYPIAFATRTPSSDKGHHWWNTPFTKMNYLYMFDKARKHMFGENKVYLVEGYMDALLLYQAGIKNVCAIMGTSFGHRKVSLISRYCDRVAFCLDVDKNDSGQKGANKAIDLLDTFSLCSEMSMVNLPVGEDPDEFVLEHGAEKLKELEVPLSDKDLYEIHQTVKKLQKEKVAMNLTFIKTDSKLIKCLTDELAFAVDKVTENEYGESSFYIENVSECSRRISYRVMSPEYAGEIKPDLLKANHPYVVKKWVDYFSACKGVDVEETNSLITDCRYNLIDNIDLLIRVLETFIVVKIKEVDGKTFSSVLKKGAFKKDTVEIMMQISISEYEHGLFIYENAETKEFSMHHVVVWNKVVNGINKKCLDIQAYINNNKLPPRPYDNKDSKECNVCEFRNECWK